MAHSDDARDPAHAATVTLLLGRAAAGDAGAAADLLPLVYERLRDLAGQQMRRERGDHTLQATALVHDAYLRLVDTSKPQVWENRWHFYAAAAESMRRILVEKARSRGRLKRGAGATRVDLDSIEISVDAPPDDLIALDEALTEFAASHPEKAKLVTLRFFAGLTQAEAAQAMGISTSSADRQWAYARAWLYRKLSQES